MGQVKWMMVRGGMLHEIDLILLVLQVVCWNQTVQEKRWMESMGEWLYHLWKNTVLLTIKA